MMRFIATILLFLFVFNAKAQKADVKMLDNAMKDFDRALIIKDSVILKKLLNEKISYGHSNGWLQSKKDVIADLYNGKLVYRQITAHNEVVTVEGSTAAVRMDADIDVDLDGKPLAFRLKVLQVWVWKNAHWELLGRQSVKI